jgi:hypothetical protein
MGAGLYYVLINWRFHMITKMIYKCMKWIKLDENGIQWYDFKRAMGLLNSLTTRDAFAS